MIEMAENHTGNIHSVATMLDHIDRSSVIPTRFIDNRNVDCFRCGGRVLKGQPLVITEIGVSFSKAIVAGCGWPDLAQHITTTYTCKAAPVGVVEVFEEHLTLNQDIRSARFNLSRERLALLEIIHIPNPLAIRVDRDSIRGCHA